MEIKHRREKVVTQICATKGKAYLKRKVEEYRLDRCRSRKTVGDRVSGILKYNFAASYDLYR